MNIKKLLGFVCVIKVVEHWLVQFKVEKQFTGKAVRDKYGVVKDIYECRGWT